MAPNDARFAKKIRIRRQKRANFLPRLNPYANTLSFTFHSKFFDFYPTNPITHRLPNSPPVPNSLTVPQPLLGLAPVPKP